MYFTSLYGRLHAVTNRGGFLDVRRRQSVLIRGVECLN